MDKIGKYEVLEKIAEGGFAEYFEPFSGEPARRVIGWPSRPPDPTRSRPLVTGGSPSRRP